MSKIRLFGTSSGYVEIAPAAAASNNTLTAPSTVGEIIAKDAAGAIGVTSIVTTNATITTAKVGAAVTISESGIDASGIGITCANINGQQISGRRNLIVNGEMKVAQREGTTATAVTNIGAKFVLDRWMVGTAQGGGTSLTVQQQHGNPTGAPYGYAASMKMTVAVVDDGGSDSFNVVQTRMENLDTNYLAFGTSQAKTVTLQFYVKSSLTGTFGGSLVSGDFSKGYVFQYTINSADTWEKKVITIPGDTTSTADSVYNRGSATSARGLVLYFDLGSGSNSEKSAANDWTATATWGYAARIAGNVKLCANAGATWSMTGCQLEVGSQATEFEHRSYGDELTLCQRYFQTVRASSVTASNANNCRFNCPLLCEMRAEPSVGKGGSGNINVGDMVSIGSNSSATPSSDGYSFDRLMMTCAVGGFTGLTAYRTYCHEPSSGNLGLITCSAEL